MRKNVEAFFVFFVFFFCFEKHDQWPDVGFGY